MPLRTLTIDFDPDASLPPDVAAFIDDAAQRIESFLDATQDDPIHEFVISDFPAVFHLLEAIERCGAASGRSFCEWGAGFGVVAGLAAMAGFDAAGIEIDPRLTDAAQQLMDDHDLPVEIVCGSLVPDGADMDRISGGQTLATLLPGPPAYDDLGLDLDDFDVVFVFPWPDEAAALAKLFEHFAAPGALLITNHGVDELVVRRKIGRP